MAAVLYVAVMFLAAELSGIDAFIFPEMLALLIGMLCTDRVPWKTDNVHTVLMMTISALVGVAIVTMVPFPMYFQAVIGFIVIGLLMILANCSLMPCIAACLFPIYFKESSIFYPILVAVMVVFVVLIRGRFINKGKIEESVKFRYLPDFEEDLRLWGMIALAFILLSAIPLCTEYMFFIAPPVAVTLAEGSSKKLTGRRVKIWFVITVAAVIGVLSRYVLNDMLELPVFIAATAVTALVLLEMRLMNMMFPPAGAVAILAFLVEGNTFLYPPMICVGAAIVLAVSSFINSRAEGYNG